MNIGSGILILIGVILVTVILLGMTATSCLGWIGYRCEQVGGVTVLWIICVVVGGIYVLLDGNERGFHSH